MALVFIKKKTDGVIKFQSYKNQKLQISSLYVIYSILLFKINKRIFAAQKVYQNSKKVYQVMIVSSWLTTVTHRLILQPFRILRQTRRKIQNVKTLKYEWIGDRTKIPWSNLQVFILFFFSQQIYNQ